MVKAPPSKLRIPKNFKKKSYLYFNIIRFCRWILIKRIFKPINNRHDFSTGFQTKCNGDILPISLEEKKNYTRGETGTVF